MDCRIFNVRMSSFLHEYTYGRPLFIDSSEELKVVKRLNSDVNRDFVLITLLSVGIIL